MPIASTGKRIAVLLAEDHETVRQALRLLLEEQSDIRIVAEAATGAAAVAASQRYLPDVAIIDISMPDMNGLEAVRQINQRAPGIGIVTLTRYRDRAFVQELLSAGARAYVLKQSRPVALLTAIRAV